MMRVLAYFMVICMGKTQGDSNFLRKGHIDHNLVERRLGELVQQTAGGLEAFERSIQSGGYVNTAA